MKNTTNYNDLAPKKIGGFFEDFFNGNLTDFFGSDFSIQTPSINIVEGNDNYRIEVAAPGLEKEDFEIKVENGMLAITAKKEQQEEVNKDKFVRREFNYTSFKRSFQLPKSVDAGKIEANYKNGVLSLNLPKLDEAKAKEIKVIEIS
ncbi:MAG: Hsp20/alpha crystallin family protein [Chitinophagales bacterium]|nr:Hsp20/alpha crystallin family protein [Chitinophagales bacterium]